MVANDKPAGTLRYEEMPVYTTSNGCPVNGPYFPHQIYHSSLRFSNLLDLYREYKAFLALHTQP